MSIFFFFCKQRTAYEMRISDWSSDVCSSDLALCADSRSAGVEQLRNRRDDLADRKGFGDQHAVGDAVRCPVMAARTRHIDDRDIRREFTSASCDVPTGQFLRCKVHIGDDPSDDRIGFRSEEHTSELQSLMRISYAVFCLKNKN